MDFIDEVQKARGVEGEFVAAHGTKAIRADAVLDLEQTDPQEMLERATDSGFSADPRISHEAAIRDRRLAGLGVGEGIEDNQDRAVRSGQVCPKTSAHKPLKQGAAGADPIPGVPSVSVDEVLSWLSRRDRKTLADPFHRRAKIAAKKHHH